MYILNELSLPSGKKDGYYKMINRDGSAGSNNLYIPLEFWFCRNVGLALPLIALQYHEVKVNILFQTETKCAFDGTTGPVLDSASLWVDYIFLDTDERRRFAQLSHEYLIEQLQFTGAESVSDTQAKPKLSFNHPCKELYWFVTADHDAGAAITNQNWYNYTITPRAGNGSTVDIALSATNGAVISVNPVKTAKLVLNGNDRFSERPGSYFNLIQPFQHHENVPSNQGINVYSFALKPEEHQPSGTLNMSRIDTAVLNLSLQLTPNATSSLSVYAVNYNVLRILSGMGGLAYSN